MSHPPQASLSSSGRTDASLPRQSTARFDERVDDLASPRTRSADGRSSEERVSEEQAFERAAAQLRPAWASGQARQYLSAPSSSAPISGTTPLPPASDAPAAVPSPAFVPSAVASPAAVTSPSAVTSSTAVASVASPASAREGAVRPAVPSVIVSPSASSSTTLQPAAPIFAHAADLRSRARGRASTGALRDDGDSHDEIELSDAIYEGEPLLGPQPVYAASHSNFPAQPFDVGVTSSTEFRSRHITDETDEYSRVAGRFSLAGLKQRFEPLNVKLLAIGAAACLAIGSVWALASGDSPATAPVGAVQASQPSNAAQAKPPVAPAPRAPAAAATGGAAPAELPTGRELPDSLLPSRSRDSAAGARAGGSVPASAVAKPSKAEGKAAKAHKTVTSASKKTPAKNAPAKLGAMPVAPKSKALPAAKTAKPQAKPAGKSRTRGNDVVDPWGR